MDAQAAARFGDEIAHGFGVASMVAGAVVGALVGAAVIGAVAATGGVAAVILGGAIAAGGLSGAQLVKALATIFNLPEPTSGTLARGSPNVAINGRWAMRAGDDAAASCNGLPFNHPPWPAPVTIAQGSRRVRINGRPAARVTNKLSCGAHIKSGSPNVFIGGPDADVAAVFDLEAWLHSGLEALGAAALIGGGVLAAAAGAVAFGIFAGATAGVMAAFEGLGRLGDRLGPGYRDLLQGTAGMAALLAGPKVVRKSSHVAPEEIRPSRPLVDLLNEKWNPNNVARALAAKRGDSKLDALLTDHEYLAIRAYTSGLYKQINPALRSGNPGEWRVLADEAATGMKKMADSGYGFQGITRRDVTLTDEEIAELFPDNGIHVDNGFMSSTTKSAGVFEGNTVISVYSKTGVVIQDVSEVPWESEVLFRPGTSFNVLGKVFDHPVKGMRFIQIEEIDPI
ncbi:PAAR motif-containing protein [Methylocaldum marinum]|uniref:PAAR motif-containing protein n=1 Tax=Methylocaldum marinum TaxID=1432792 RepID=A0A250KV30_9GAMM|nr:PAAR domain-containing protein [Methylocaldum marinum]BBA35518.1 PAAR motif-containing protein [Methylocaldum marinum]